MIPGCTVEIADTDGGIRRGRLAGLREGHVAVWPAPVAKTVTELPEIISWERINSIRIIP